MADQGRGPVGREDDRASISTCCKRYHGPKVKIEPVYAIEWAYIPHFYFGFYVFQYATSITARDLLRAEA